MLHLPGACVVAELFLGRSELIWSRANSTPAAQKAVAAHTVLRVCVDMTGGLLKGTLSSFVFSKSVSQLTGTMQSLGQIEKTVFVIMRPLIMIIFPLLCLNI